MITIGDLQLPGPLVLAPLAGYSDLPFRLLCRRMGASLCVSEMISCHGVVYRQEKTLAMLQSCAEERPVSFQLFGADPDVMSEAAEIVSAYMPDFIDINMGCPVKKVTKRGAGAALMADHKRAEQIIRGVTAKSRCPVTVKIRSGPDSRTICAGEFAVMAQDLGVSAVAVHGRTWKQGFSGYADWGVVRDVVQRVSIPVLGNGDIASNAQAHERIEASGCAGVLIGRAAIGNPWIFNFGDRPAHLGAIIATVLEHLSLIEKFNDNPDRALGSIKNHFGKYFKGIVGAARIRKSVYEQPHWKGLKSLIQSYQDDHPRLD